ncbi:MAG: sel1 repeat family protein, partial [Selenomonadaceae bacterium]|nr:sel1 repeat family protein [Selenomonadaceae bacterium]
MTEEKTLLQKAEAGDIESIKQLAKLYDKKSGRWQNEPNVGESISIEELFANMDKKSDENFLAEAFKYFMRGAELGDPECMYEVAHKIYDAIGCYKDVEWNERGKKSFEWYLKSAQAGYAPAMRITAYMYGGLCVDKDEVQSFKWYLKSAEHGDKQSAREVAKMFAKGVGTDKNLEAADKWLAKLNDEDYLHTLHELSNGYDDESLMWLERLVELDDPLALKKKAEACCIKQKFEEALKLFIKAGTSDLPENYNPDVLAEALFQAGNLYYTGEGSIPQSDGQALRYYKKAARFRYIKAYVQCGKMYYEREDFPQAIRYFKYALKTRDRYPFARGQNPIALEYMGRMFERGEFVEIDLEVAYKYYEAAAKDTRNQALIFRLANDYFYGNNVAKNINKALSYFEEAGR